MKLPLWVVNLICLSGVRTGGVGMLHIGQLIACTLHEQGRTVTWFARQLCCTRPNVYKIFGKENIDISLLWRISCILHHDFFGDLSQEMKCDVNFSLPFGSGTE